jgi:dihydrofolate reductase
MRTVTYGGAVSSDGFLAGLNGEIDWLHYSKDVQQVMTEYWKDVDTVLMGRKSYTIAAANDTDSAEREKRQVPVVRTYVFSRTLKSIDAPDIELVAGDAVEFVRRLKLAPGKGQRLPELRQAPTHTRKEPAP